jgi:hypothetical protein
MSINFAETQLAPVRAQQGQYIPEDVKRQLLAAQLLQQTASDTSAPVYSKGLGMAKLLAGGLGGLMEGYEQSKENAAQKESYAKLASVLSPGSEAPAPAADSGGGIGAFLGKLLSGKSDAPAPAPEPAPATVAEAPVKPAAFAPAELAAGLEGKGLPAKITSGSTISPQDRDAFIRTVATEDNSPEGRAAVAAVIRNRTMTGRWGDTPGKVVQAKGQFEPWMNGRAQAVDPNSQDYKAAAAIVDQTMGGAPDPTNGATHFYGPEAQRALGRQPPSWAQGEGQRIGGNAYYAPEGRVNVAQSAPQSQPQAAPQQIAQAAPQPTTPPQPPIQAPARGDISAAGLMAILQDQRIPPELKQAAYTQYNSPKTQVLKEGDVLVDRNGRLIYKTPEKPMSVAHDARVVQDGKVVVPADNQQFRPLTDPAERAKFGIPANDKRAFQVGPDNKLSEIGGSLVTIDQKAPGAFETTYGEGMGKEALATVKAGETSWNNKQNIGLVRNLLSGIQTGKLAPYQATIGGYMQSVGMDPATFGINPDMPTTAESVAAITNKMVLGSIGGPGGMPANNFSDADRKFLGATQTQLANRPEANNLILTVGERIADLQQEKAGAWLEARDRGESYEKFERNWQREIMGRNLFADLSSQMPNGQPGVAPPSAPMPQPPQQAKTPQPQASAPVNVKGMTPADIRKLPRGTPLILPDGAPGVVP